MSSSISETFRTNLILSSSTVTRRRPFYPRIRAFRLGLQAVRWRYGYASVFVLQDVLEGHHRAFHTGGVRAVRPVVFASRNHRLFLVIPSAQPSTEALTIWLFVSHSTFTLRFPVVWSFKFCRLSDHFAGHGKKKKKKTIYPPTQITWHIGQSKPHKPHTPFRLFYQHLFRSKQRGNIPYGKRYPTLKTKSGLWYNLHRPPASQLFPQAIQTSIKTPLICYFTNFFSTKPVTNHFIPPNRKPITNIILSSLLICYLASSSFTSVQLPT